jgi:hypothetical protein
MVYDHDIKQNPNVRFIIGLNDDKYFHDIKVYETIVYPEYIKFDNENHDIALLILDYPIGDELGWASLDIIDMKMMNTSNKKYFLYI